MSIFLHISRGVMTSKCSIHCRLTNVCKTQAARTAQDDYDYCAAHCCLRASWNPRFAEGGPRMQRDRFPERPALKKIGTRFCARLPCFEV